ncbi:MAG TPA: hypothetical protein VEY93_16440, partial [Longimicrobium sp.]|nr:hypothetical protein [Longimicrobium sp.]
MNTPEKAETPVIPLRLPELRDDGQPGAGFVKRAVSYTLGFIGLLLVGGVLVSMFVTMDITVKTVGVLEPVQLWPVRAQAGGVVRQVLVKSG